MTVTMPDDNTPEDPHRDLFGGTNGRGGHSYDSVERIMARQQAEASAMAKAAEDPATLTLEDLAALPGAVMSDLMAKGGLTHLGFGRRHTGRRH